MTPDLVLVGLGVVLSGNRISEQQTPELVVVGLGVVLWWSTLAGLLNGL